MHISLRQTVDRINSQRADQLLDQEIDLELNRAMQRFINQRYGKNNVYQEGFEESQKRIDELRTLLVEYEAGVTFKEELRPGRIFVDQFQLPKDYMYLVNQRSKIFTENCQPLVSTYAPADDIHYFTFNFLQLMVNGNEFVDSIRMQDTEFGTNPSTSPPVWQASPELVSFGYVPQAYPSWYEQVVIDMLTNPQPGFTIYAESYGPLNFPEQFIVVVDIDGAGDFFNWDGSGGSDPTPLVSMNATNDQIAFVPPHFHDQSGILTRVPESSTVTEDTVLNKFSQQDDIYRLLDDPFNSTTHTSPLTTIRGNFIDIYTNAIFITSSAKITYLRKPQPISLSLGYNCELPDHTHEEVIAMAASSILEESSDPRYKTQLGEAMNRE
tara:strand:+ start:1746 stop:2891 length:1146 start_codon:yes stop_codon:yes gene_type:complete